MKRKKEVSVINTDIVIEQIKNLAFYTLLEQMPVAFYWIDKDGYCLGCNQEELAILGLDSVNQFVGKHALELFEKNAWLNSKEVIDKRTIQSFEEICPLKDGNKKYFFTIKAPFFDELNNAIGLIGLSLDITERKKNEQELREAKEQLETANQALSLLSGSIAHELRTPLSAISSGMSGIMKHLSNLLTSYDLAKNSNIPVPFIAKHQLASLNAIANNLKSEVKFANIMIDMLLVKIQQPSLSHSFNIYSMKSCIETALERYPLTQEERNLIHYESTNDFQFQGNELMVIHIFFNLLKNALYHIKAAEKGMIKIWLEIGEYYNIVHVKDTGPGIAKDNLPHIFEKFYSKTQGGTGIGLAFCKTVMQELGGEISCVSIKNKYTTFTLSFPKKY